MTVRILQGDCRDVMATLPEASVDAIVTDPPYGLGFMGKRWDSFTPSDHPMHRRAETDAVNTGVSRQRRGHHARDMREFQAWCEQWAFEAMRVLKPGGYMLAFGGTRTYHRLACAIEDVGFEVRDQVAWVYGAGFPKSHNGPWGGTALKPAWEPVCMARKPLAGTVEANWRKYGTGALNIDACRVGDDGGCAGAGAGPAGPAPRVYGNSGLNGPFAPRVPGLGRWPANLLHDGSDEVLAAFPQDPEADEPAAVAAPAESNGVDLFGDAVASEQIEQRVEGGSAARFFYSAKATRYDRDEGLEWLEGRQTDDGRRVPADNAYQRGKTARQNHHPTVKPTDLMRYFCRLVMPCGGTVLDPFMGSGSTLKAAELEGFSAIGIELDHEYIEIARRRIAADVPLFAEVEVVP